MDEAIAGDPEADSLRATWLRVGFERRAPEPVG
jgi:hypothetical protein